MRRLSYLLIILLFSCKQDEIKRSYPLLTTDDVTDISKQGAHFSASFTNAVPDDIVDCGFVWGASEKLDLSSNLFIKLPKPSGSVFSATVNSNLLVSTRYYVRPFLRTKDVVVYGKSVSFISLGSAAPVIDDFSPKKAKTGDTVVFTGKYFGQNIKEAKLVFESTTNQTSVTASISKLSENEARVVVPPDLIEKTTRPRLEILGNSTRATSTFELTLPEVLTLANPVLKYCDSISATINTNGYTVTKVELNGTASGFKQSGQNLKMALSIPASPLSIRLYAGKLYGEKSFPVNIENPSLQTGYPTSILSNDTITFKLKYPLTNCGFQLRYVNLNSLPSPQLIILHQTLQEVTFTFSQDYCPSSPMVFEFYNADTKVLTVSDINIKKPEIISISPAQVNAGDEITLSVKNIVPTTKFTGPFIGNALAAVSQISKTQIKAVVPTALAYSWDGLKSTQGFIPVTLASCYTYSDVNLTIEPKTPVITSLNPDPINSANQIITINGDNFTPVPDLNLISIQGRYPPVLSASKTQLTFNSSEVISNLSLKGTLPMTVTTLGKSTNISANIDYHGLWTSIGGPGADNRLESFQFTVNGKGYFGGGTYNGTSYRDVWEYDPTTNHWTRMADYPGIATSGYVFFSTGTKAYVGMGQGQGPSFTEATDWWEFDPSLNKWTAKAAYPGTGRHYLTIFAINGTGYVGGGKDLNYVSHKDFWAYDSSSDTWKAKADLPASLLFTEYPPSFGFNGLGYTFNFDVDFVSATRTQRLHIYDPTSNSWATNPQHQSPPEMPAEIPLVFSNFVVIGNYVFNPITDQIKSFNNYDNNRTFRCRFAIGNAGYFGLGFNINASINDFYWLDTTKL